MLGSRVCERASGRGRQWVRKRGSGARRRLADDRSSHEDVAELAVVNLSVLVCVDECDELVGLFGGQLLSARHEHGAQLGGVDLAVAVLVQHAERVDDVGDAEARVLEPRHDAHKVLEAHVGAAERGQLGLGRVVAQRAHRGAQRRRRDRVGRARRVDEEREGLAQLGELLRARGGRRRRHAGRRRGGRGGPGRPGGGQRRSSGALAAARATVAARCARLLMMGGRARQSFRMAASTISKSRR